MPNKKHCLSEDIKLIITQLLDEEDQKYFKSILTEEGLLKKGLIGAGLLTGGALLGSGGNMAALGQNVGKVGAVAGQAINKGINFVGQNVGKAASTVGKAVKDFAGNVFNNPATTPPTGGGASIKVPDLPKRGVLTTKHYQAPTPPNKEVMDTITNVSNKTNTNPNTPQIFRPEPNSSKSVANNSSNNSSPQIFRPDYKPPNTAVANNNKLRIKGLDNENS